MLQNGYYIPENDIVQTLADGRQVLLAAKGVPVPEAEARRLGYIKDGEAGPSEIKADAVVVPAAEQSAAGNPVLAIGSNATSPRARKNLK